MSKQTDGDDAMSGSDKTRARRNAREREKQTVVKDLADLGLAVHHSGLSHTVDSTDPVEIGPRINVYQGGITAAQLQEAIQREYGKARTPVEDMPREQQRAVFAAIAEEGGGEHPLVSGALKRPVANIGQLTREDVAHLESAVKRGVLRRGRGGSFPIPKTVYAHPSYNIEAAHAQAVNYLRSLAGKGLITVAELEEKAQELMQRTGKTAEQLLAEIYLQQEIDAKLKPLTLFKQADGRLRVFGWASNNRRDNDHPPEIITEAAHKEFMAYLDANPNRAPEFWHWHTPGTRYAKADWWDYADGFTVYSGLVDAGKEKQAQAAASDGIGMSHGFHVLGYDAGSKSITQYRTFEVSDLPITRAANPFTSFIVVQKEAAMPFSDAKRKYLLERLTPEDVAALEGKTSALKAAADAAGIEWKELEELPSVALEAKATDKEGDQAEEQPTADPAPVPDADLMAKIRAVVREEVAAVGKSLETTQAAVLSVAESVAAADAKATEALAKAVVADSAALEARKSLDDQVAELIRPRTRIGSSFSPATAASTRKKGEEPAAPAVKTKDEPTLPGAPGVDWFSEKVMKPAGLV